MIHCKMLFNDSAKSKREVEKTGKNEGCQQVQLSPHLCNVCFFFSGSVEMKMSFVHVSAFLPKPISKEITEVTLKCQFICSTCVHQFPQSRGHYY